MPEPVEFTVDGAPLRAAAGTSLAAAMLDAGITTFRHSRGGAPRGPVCGMGICFECRVTIDGVAHRRACLELVRPGMAVRTGE
jgi:sarcosine oxidase subunit alpha